VAGIVDIVNRALAKLGGARIAALGEKVPAAALAASLFETVRDAEISAHGWHFAMTRKIISAEVEKPAFGWANQFLLPADCLRLLMAGPWPGPVMRDLIADDSRLFVLEGGRILTNLGPTVPVRYLRRVEDPALYPAVFVEALACRLAAEMAESLTGSTSKKQMA